MTLNIALFTHLKALSKLVHFKSFLSSSVLAANLIASAV
jgi:hypothetical protein